MKKLKEAFEFFDEMQRREERKALGLIGSYLIRYVARKRKEK